VKDGRAGLVPALFVIVEGRAVWGEGASVGMELGLSARSG